MYKELSSLTINYGRDNIEREYRKLSGKCNINDYIKYTPRPNKTIHFVLNIMVSDGSAFVPFVFGAGEINKIRVNDLARSILRENAIEYNFSDFIGELAEKNKLKESELPRVTIKTRINEDTMTVEVAKRFSTKEDGKLWFNTLDTDKKVDTEGLLCKRKDGKKTFAEVMTMKYNDVFSVPELYFRFVNIDSNYTNSGRLSQIMIISPDDEEISLFLTKSLEKIREIISLIRSRYVYDLLAKNRYEATKSAKAAIMSRNMSHNIGSHVMSYLKQKLGSITAIMSGENKVLYNLIDGEKVNLKVLEKKSVVKTENVEQSTTEKINQLQLPFLVGTGRFIGYLQERQDYIATIATDYIPYGAPVNLKDAIYDELNPDLRYMRHKSDDNKPMNVLLSFIAKSEGLSRENMDNCSVENDVKSDKFDTNHDILFGFPKYEPGKEEPEVFGLLPDKCESANEALTLMRKINFCLPGGLVGRQAIFSIVENLIRNAAKHGDRSHTRKNNLEFTFDVIDLAKLQNEPCLGDRICDEQWRTLYEQASDSKDLYLLTITDNLIYPTGAGNLAEKLRPALTDEYVDEMGNMNTSNKGIKEIRISAAWMRGEVDENRYFRYGDKTDADKKAPLVGLEITNKGHLRYMICLPQDRLVAVVTDGMSEADIKLFEEMNAYSPKDWTLCSIEQVKENSKTSFHYILVANENTYNQLRPFTSNRLFVWNLPDEDRAELAEYRKQEEDDSVRYKLTKNAIVRKLYDIKGDSEPIYIWDEKTKENELDNLDISLSDRIKIYKTDENADKAKYVYRTHHSTDKNFEDYWRKKSKTEGVDENSYSNIIRIDAITGDNSSDRIVRREPLNEEWYCSHLRSLEKRVAIFDERLFKIVHNVDERNFIPEHQGSDGNTSSFASYISRLENTENFQAIKNEIVERKLFGDDTEGIMSFVDTAEELINELEHQAVFFIPQTSNNYKSIVYQEKGVDVFTIVKERKNTFAVIGFVGYENDANGNLEKTHYDKVATITFTADPFDVSIEFQHKEFAKQYDYISIHQGILDKIYEEFGIKDQGTANDLSKCYVTRRLHEEFMLKNIYTPIPVMDRNGNVQSKELDFLPCFIIHSGRAKPTKNDMPQELPFVQYAAIEHGVLDCKYALVELLDYARYED